MSRDPWKWIALLFGIALCTALGFVVLSSQWFRYVFGGSDSHLPSTCFEWCETDPFYKDHYSDCRRMFETWHDGLPLSEGGLVQEKYMHEQGWC